MMCGFLVAKPTRCVICSIRLPIALPRYLHGCRSSNVPLPYLAVLNALIMTWGHLILPAPAAAGAAAAAATIFWTHQCSC